MDFLLNRYRNLSVLLLAILAQLALLAYQVKSNRDVRLIRVWAVSAVTPLARVIETGRGGISRFFHDYFVLLDVRDENKRIKADLDRTELENQYLRAELSTADRAKSLALFQATSQSKFLAAHIIGNTTDTSGKVVIVDRGSASGILKGMAVVTPDGIVGKVTSVYPTAAFVLLITDPSFAAGVISQKNHVHGTLKGQGHSTVMIDYVQNEEPLDQGEWFVTSGDDLIFPRGLPVGQATVVRAGRARKEIYVTPSGLQNLEDVLIIIEGVHGPIPDAPPGNQQVYQLAPPTDEVAATANTPAQTAPAGAIPGGSPNTDADRLVEHYKAIGAAQNHKFGDKGTPAPDYNAGVATAPRPSSEAPAAPSPAPPAQP